MKRLIVVISFSLFAAAAQDGVPQAFFDSPVIREGRYALWHDPGAVETLDFRYGIGGQELAPRPPFTFVEEDTSGTDPKVKVKDANKRTWVVKFGHEASPDTFCTRLAWALGYYVEPNYYVADGVMEGAHDIHRAHDYVDGKGRFKGGRFQLRSSQPKYLRVADWSWTDNPFLGTPELGGLKILFMLLSNWDNKDDRDQESRGTNTAIYQQGDRMFFFIDDWGGAMGNWGKFLTRSKWNAKNFERQSGRFVSVDDGKLRWGYVGQHTALITRDVSFKEIDWLMQYLGRVTDQQLHDGLIASGATEEQAQYYMAGIRERIRQMQQVRSLDAVR